MKKQSKSNQPPPPQPHGGGPGLETCAECGTSRERHYSSEFFGLIKHRFSPSPAPSVGSPSEGARKIAEGLAGPHDTALCYPRQNHDEWCRCGRPNRVAAIEAALQKAREEGLACQDCKEYRASVAGEIERLKGGWQQSDRDRRKHFDQSCTNLKRAEEAEAALGIAQAAAVLVRIEAEKQHERALAAEAERDSLKGQLAELEPLRFVHARTLEEAKAEAWREGVESAEAICGNIADQVSIRPRVTAFDALMQAKAVIRALLLPKEPVERGEGDCAACEHKVCTDPKHPGYLR